MTLPPIPADTLRAVYTREKPYRHHWPDSYEAGMSDPIISRVVELLARHVPTFGRRRAERARIQPELDIPRGKCKHPPEHLVESSTKLAASGEDNREYVCVNCHYVYASTDRQCRRCGSTTTLRE